MASRTTENERNPEMVKVVIARHMEINSGRKCSRYEDPVVDWPHIDIKKYATVILNSNAVDRREPRWRRLISFRFRRVVPVLPRADRAHDVNMYISSN